MRFYTALSCVSHRIVLDPVRNLGKDGLESSSPFGMDNLSPAGGAPVMGEPVAVGYSWIELKSTSSRPVVCAHWRNASAVVRTREVDWVAIGRRAHWSSGLQIEGAPGLEEDSLSTTVGNAPSVSCRLMMITSGEGGYAFSGSWRWPARLL